ncbi:hypothetical protein Misp04_11820 [Micromonospora sp. NBRC 101691]|nr:hypothetical protein Misp04_11820 [Micromonospora sp. NBRC 101691]
MSQMLGEVDNDPVTRGEQLVYLHVRTGQADLTHGPFDVVPALDLRPGAMDHHVVSHYGSQFVKVAGHEHL